MPVDAGEFAGVGGALPVVVGAGLELPPLAEDADGEHHQKNTADSTA